MTGFLVIGVFSFLTLGAVIMHHSEKDHNNCLISLSSDCSTSKGINFCAEFHLGIFKRAYYAGIKNISSELLDFIRSSVLGFSIFILIQNRERLRGYFRMRLRQINNKAMGIFWIKIGQWLIMYFKRDPYALAFA